MTAIFRPRHPPRQDGGWRHDAACRGMDSAVFFHPDGERGLARERRIQTAVRVCQRCPVCEPCRQWAHLAGEWYGVWGGEDETTRRHLLRGTEPPAARAKPRRVLRGDPRLDEPGAGWRSSVLDADCLCGALLHGLFHFFSPVVGRVLHQQAHTGLVSYFEHVVGDRFAHTVTGAFVQVYADSHGEPPCSSAIDSQKPAYDRSERPGSLKVEIEVVTVTARGGSCPT